ncbi:MAG TPA: plastocyanin/azurin family copper-binding protein [Casimicrobiaceae bacterium]|nr:plastocyanin/azurin family copper-binding protein [Casimicrobiaceae bacterium]
MPEVLAAIRPAGQDFPVLLHIVGATIVFGALLASAGSLALARGRVRLFRIGYFALLFVALPGWILMRLSGEWIYRKQGWNDVPDQLQDPTWLRIGFGVADWGGLLFLLALIVGGVAVLRLRSGKSGAGLLKVTMSIAVVLAIGYVGAVWAMTGKPNYGTASPAQAAATNASTTAVAVTASEFRFTLSKTSVPSGEIVFTVVNNGKLAHNFWIDGKTTPLVQPGASATLRVTLDPGTFTYICTVPGHAAAGMKGSLTVR